VVIYNNNKLHQYMTYSSINKICICCVVDMYEMGRHIIGCSFNRSCYRDLF